MFIILEVPINELQIPIAIMKHTTSLEETIKREDKSLRLNEDLQGREK